MAYPIWKDYYVSLGALNDSEKFRILCDGKVIYTGKAYKKPGANDISVRINEICADYLSLNKNSSNLPTFEVQRTIMSITEGEVWSTIDSVQFLNDWSYDYAYDPETMGLSFPVINRIDPRQWILFTPYNESTITARIKLQNGDSFNVYIPVKTSDDFNADFNKDFCHSVRNSQMETAVFDLSKWDNVESVTLGNNEFKVVNSCHKYALYYLNAYGGWDSLLIEGNHSKRDNLTRHTRETEYDNGNLQNRGIHNYVNEISRSLTLHTSWMTDEQSARMHHLLNSTNVYLGDIESGQMIPVVLTDTITEYKTYKGNGGKLVNYAINVTIAQERMRR